MKNGYFALLVFVMCSGCHETVDTGTLQPDILRKTQELFDSVAAGNKEPWQKYIADDVIYFDEQGHDFDKKGLLASIEPLPSGLSGTIKVVKSKFNVQANTLIHSYDMDESESVHGQQVHARYHATDTWMVRNRQWQIVAGQVLRYYEDPAPGVADARKLRDYIGTYVLDDQNETVSLDRGKLYLTRGTHARVELIPEACDIFFRKGIEGRVLFQYSQGAVSFLVDRRNNEDVVWRKMR
jgi:hypothetical protein